MRLDHIAYRVKDKHKAATFFQEALGYNIQTEFEINFSDGSRAKCIALEPPEKEGIDPELHYDLPYAYGNVWKCTAACLMPEVDYHMAPEIFISDGTPDSIVGKWVEARGGVGGIHHLAYQVNDVDAKMKEWQEKGYAEFTTEQPLVCKDLTQVFTKPSIFLGVTIELIERKKHGFCLENVRDLMESSN